MDQLPPILDVQMTGFPFSEKHALNEKENSLDPSLDSLLLQGEMLLLKGELFKGIELFEQVLKNQPSDPLIFFRQGLALLEYGSEEKKEKILLLASKKFKSAALLSPDQFDIWVSWANTFLLLAKITQEYHFYLEAAEKYRKAIDLSGDQSPDVLSELYWDFGIVSARLAEHSGEAIDLQNTLDIFQKAASLQEHLPANFWNDYGKACLKLASCINDTRLYVKAINCFKHAVSQSVSCHEGWSFLASALESLYHHTHDEDHFSQANECFATASQLRPQDVTLWLNWAKFLCHSGRRNQDAKRLRTAIEKCHRAHACTPNHPLIMAVWAEALSLLGHLSDRLDLIYEAQNKISDASQLEPDIPEIWRSYGVCLFTLGHYFNDTDYYYQAIEKFQNGLSIDRTCDSLWHEIGAAYGVIATLENDPSAFDLARRFYNRAINLNPCSYYIFDHALMLSKFSEIEHQQKWLEDAVIEFERALNLQKNAVYLHPDWLFHYACALDALGDFHEEDSYYQRAVEIFSHVLMIDPDFPRVHHHLALAFSHLGELTGEVEYFYRAVHYFRLAAKHEEENDQVILDWGITLINIAEHIKGTSDSDIFFREAEHKLTQAARLGNLQAYYHLACLYSLLNQFDKSLRFIEKADEFESLPPIEEMLQDDWLEGVRNTIDFREFLSELEKRPYLHES
jgi:tetratricopeptide (TPR) repeat protein